PFLRHSFLIQERAQIDKLRRAGVRSVEIDVERGLDLPNGQAAGVDDAPGTSTPASRSSSRTMQPKSLSRLSEEYVQATAAAQQLEQTVQSLYSGISEKGTADRNRTGEAIQEIRIVTRTVTRAALFMTLSQNRGGDSTLSRHALATCTLALIVGQTYGYNPLELNELATAALLHDIGLLHIPPSLLQRCASTSSSLSERERQQFRAHPRLSVTMLEREKGFEVSMLHLIDEHHTLLDGSGYPPETRGEFTSGLTRILAISDRYDDLLTGFGGATPLAPHQALQRLYREAQEGQLDRDIVSRLIKTFGIYPVHSCVRLNTRELAVVTEQNPSRLHQPVVTVTHEPDGAGYTMPFVVDLADQEGRIPERTIDSVLDVSPLSVEPVQTV
ncbi:MAG TPA: HD domain-containing phosphohydrolase, partial [Nitrospira sp.]|nr:HD domain-containing phosphohydrolase [Nitrospira sp.]